MNCMICGLGTLTPGTTTITLTPGTLTLVVKGVPANVCDNCGERYVDEDITDELLQLADAARRAGVQVDVRDYVAA